MFTLSTDAGGSENLSQTYISRDPGPQWETAFGGLGPATGTTWTPGSTGLEKTFGSQGSQDPASETKGPPRTSPEDQESGDIRGSRGLLVGGGLPLGLGKSAPGVTRVRETSCGDQCPRPIGGENHLMKEFLFSWYGHCLIRLNELWPVASGYSSSAADNVSSNHGLLGSMCVFSCEARLRYQQVCEAV